MAIPMTGCIVWVSGGDFAMSVVLQTKVWISDGGGSVRTEKNTTTHPYTSNSGYSRAERIVDGFLGLELEAWLLDP